jgi:hypothetical protein
MRFWAGNEVRREKKFGFFFGRVKNHFKNLPTLGLEVCRRKSVPYVRRELFRLGGAVAKVL